MLIIYGCGGHARSVTDVAISNGIKEIVYIDENARENEKILGFPVLKPFQFQSSKIHIACGDNKLRSKLYQELYLQNDIISIISSHAHVGMNATIHDGAFIGHGVHIGPNTVVGINSIVNTHCVIEHDCRVGNYTHVSVNATVAGKSSIGNFVMIGTGATVIDGIKIVDNVIVGAGSVVVRDINEPGTYVGIPAKKIKTFVES